MQEINKIFPSLKLHAEKKKDIIAIRVILPLFILVFIFAHIVMINYSMKFKKNF